jgi:hypothetical protein
MIPLSNLANARAISRCPPFQAFLEERALPSAVLGPVECFHGFQLLIAFACLDRRSCVQPFAGVLGGTRLLSSYAYSYQQVVSDLFLVEGPVVS